MKLPEPISPIKIEDNKQSKELTFLFQDIVSYAFPESSKFTFVVDDFKGEAVLETKWKLK